LFYFKVFLANYITSKTSRTSSTTAIVVHKVRLFEPLTGTPFILV